MMSLIVMCWIVVWPSSHLKWIRLLWAAHMVALVCHNVVMRLACHCVAVLGVLRVE